MLLAASSLCFGEPTVMQIPNQGWQVRFDAPPVSKISERLNPAQYYFIGNAGRFNLSLTVETPDCPGEITAADNYRCMIRKIERVPDLVRQTITTEKRANNVQVSYLTYAPVAGQMVKIMNTHVLFAYKGRWGDLHGSVVRPTPEEVAMLLALGDRFEHADSP